MTPKWDSRFLRLAQHISGWSRDPSTQVGSVIVRPDKSIASVGFNGFPRGIADDDRLNARETKYELMIHGEINAILHAREPLNGCTLYMWPFQPCARCAVQVIQTCIMQVVSPVCTNPRWIDTVELSKQMFREAGVTYYEIDPNDIL